MRYRVLWICTVIVMAMSGAAAAAPKSIFDDDWTPPKASETPRPAPPAKPAVTDPNPATPVSPVSPAVPPVSAAQPRRAVPAKPEQAAVRKVMKDIYAAQIADRSVPARRKLTEALIGQADKSASTPVDQFVLLAAAVDAAVDAADLSLAFGAADRMAAAYDVDALALKAETAARLSPKVGSPELAAANVSAGLDLVTELVAADDFAAAARLCTALVPLAAANPEARAQVQGRMRDVGAARIAHERVARDTEKLKTSPDDPAANLSVGRHLAFTKGDWKRGLGMLAKGSDPALKALAAQEIAGVSTPDAAVRLADAWWDASPKQADPASRAGVQVHAAALYRQAVGELDGLRKVQAEKRIAEAGKAESAAGGAGPGKWINLLAMIEPAKDARAGSWKLESGVLTSDKENGARVQIPYLPPEEYDFRIVFSRNDGGSGVLQYAARGDREMIWVMGYSNVFSLNDKQIDQKCKLENGRKYVSVIKVRGGSVQFFLDDKPILEEKDEGRLFQRGLWNRLSDPKLLGVGSFFSPTSFYRIEIREVTGSGKRLTE